MRLSQSRCKLKDIRFVNIFYRKKHGVEPWDGL